MPESALPSRLDRARATLAKLGLDASIVTNSANRRYLTGFTAEDHAPDEPAAIGVVSATGAWLFASPTNLPWAESEATEGVTCQPWARPWADSVIALARDGGWTRIGVEERVLPTADWFALNDGAPAGTEFVFLGTTLDSLRAQKEPEELDLLKKALQLSDEAFIGAAARIQPGMTEAHAAEIVREELRRVGSEGESFDTIVASGPNAAKPHHAPGERVIGEGEPVIIDMGAVAGGYHGDLTRTIWFGRADERLVTIYATVAAAMKASLGFFTPGVSGRDVDQQARDLFAAQGFGEYFVHGLGHGIGLRIHEAPSAGPASTDVLAPGHVVTTEPGIYIPGWGGVRIENVVVVTESGAENLTHAPIVSIDGTKETHG
ncbi:MAG: Xaa-Pro peptidase family protein [Thermomicrobiales bacterium]